MNSGRSCQEQSGDAHALDASRGRASGSSISLTTFSWYFERRKKKLGSDLA